MASIVGTMVLRPRRRRRNAATLRTSSPAGMVEGRLLRIGGIEQWVTIRGEDRANPILLFLHGGPGAGHTMYNTLTRPWEQHFTLVQWDQRGSGRTLRRNGPPEPGELSFARLESDGIEVAEQVLRHLGHEKLILVASSVGSTFGTAIASRRSDLLHAFVGTDMSTGPEAQDLSYSLTLAGLRESGNTKGAEAVERMGPDHDNWTIKQFDEMVRWTIRADPTIPHMVKDVIFPALMSSPSHSMRDIRDLAAGIKLSTRALYDEMRMFDVRALGLDFDVPFFVFQGDRDAVTPTAAASAYLDEVRAPFKELVLLENCGHLAAFTRPEQFLDELVTRVRPFAVDNSIQEREVL